MQRSVHFLSLGNRRVGVLPVNLTGHKGWNPFVHQIKLIQNQQFPYSAWSGSKAEQSTSCLLYTS
ncbi:MAG: hypothetical protein N3D16_11895, partial [Anaerolineales bacterium]|nr:hypothetical protein [Anaerolineales bacterium]